MQNVFAVPVLLVKVSTFRTLTQCGLFNKSSLTVISHVFPKFGRRTRGLRRGLRRYDWSNSNFELWSGFLFFILRLSCNTRDVFARAHVPMAEEKSELATAHGERIGTTSSTEVPQAGLFKLVCDVAYISLSTLSLERVTIWPLVGSGTWQSPQITKTLQRQQMTRRSQCGCLP